MIFNITFTDGLTSNWTHIIKTNFQITFVLQWYDLMFKIKLLNDSLLFQNQLLHT